MSSKLSNYFTLTIKVLSIFSISKMGVMSEAIYIGALTSVFQQNIPLKDN